MLADLAPTIEESVMHAWTKEKGSTALDSDLKQPSTDRNARIQGTAILGIAILGV